MHSLEISDEKKSLQSRSLPKQDKKTLQSDMSQMAETAGSVGEFDIPYVLQHK